MRLPDRAALLLVPLLGAARLAAQAPGWREGGFWAVAVAARPAFGGVGLAVAWRDALRTRVGLAGAVGAEDGAGVAGRLEGTWHFLFDPYRRTGNALYAGAGLALQFAHSGDVEPGLQIVVGLEGAAALRRSGFIEVGVGRGARVALGLRWRKRSR